MRCAMRFPVPIIKGVIDRRILVNFRVQPDALAKLLPAPFRPKLVKGYGLAGICLIRLEGIRPRGLPSFVGVASENAAHRIAVEWERGGQLREGVFIPRRHTNSQINVWAGGKLFPGLHRHARFESFERNGHIHVQMESPTDGTRVLVTGHVSERIPRMSVFKSLDEASRFFERGSLGYSATENPREFDGLELRSFDWKVRPLALDAVESSFFENKEMFPHGSLEFDCALLMREIEHEWHAQDTLQSCDF